MKESQNMVGRRTQFGAHTYVIIRVWSEVFKQLLRLQHRKQMGREGEHWVERLRWLQKMDRARMSWQSGVGSRLFNNWATNRDNKTFSTLQEAVQILRALCYTARLQFCPSLFPRLHCRFPWRFRILACILVGKTQGGFGKPRWLLEPSSRAAAVS